MNERAALNAAIEAIAARFRSGNRIPVDKATVPASEWDALVAALAQPVAAEPATDIVSDLVAALEMFVGTNAIHSLCEHEGMDAMGRVKGTWSKAAEVNARTVLKIHGKTFAPTSPTGE